MSEESGSSTEWDLDFSEASWLYNNMEGLDDDIFGEAYVGGENV